MLLRYSYIASNASECGVFGVKRFDPGSQRHQRRIFVTQIGGILDSGLRMGQRTRDDQHESMVSLRRVVSDREPNFSVFQAPTE